VRATLAKGIERVWLLPATLAVLCLALIGTVLLRTGVVHVGGAAAAAVTASGPIKTPENVDVEAELGVRFSHVAVVGGGGLVELTYTVLDPEKATTFQSDTTHPPTLYKSGDRANPVDQSALMKQGHNLRPGQTYFILYENTHGILKTGDTAEIHSKAGTLTDFPVE